MVESFLGMFRALDVTDSTKETERKRRKKVNERKGEKLRRGEEICFRFLRVFCISACLFTSEAKIVNKGKEKIK